MCKVSEEVQTMMCSRTIAGTMWLELQHEGGAVEMTVYRRLPSDRARPCKPLKGL